MWFGRKINSVAGFGGESARLVYITSRYRKPAAPSQRGIPGGCRPQSGSLFLCVDAVFYADEIEKAGWEVRFPLDSLGKQVMAVFVDIYGNEARDVIPASTFSVQKTKTGSKRTRRANDKSNN
jgi:hypothetical protein